MYSTGSLILIFFSCRLLQFNYTIHRQWCPRGLSKGSFPGTSLAVDIFSLEYNFKMITWIIWVFTKSITWNIMTVHILILRIKARFNPLFYQLHGDSLQIRILKKDCSRIKSCIKNRYQKLLAYLGFSRGVSLPQFDATQNFSLSCKNFTLEPNENDEPAMLRWRLLAPSQKNKSAKKNHAHFSWYAFSCGRPEMHLGCAKILLTLSSDANISSRLKNMGVCLRYIWKEILKRLVLFKNGKRTSIKWHF